MLGELEGVEFPSLWVWDYTALKFNPGFAILIIDENAETWILHFNQHWDGKMKYRHKNTKKDDFVKVNMDIKDIKKYGNFIKEDWSEYAKA